MNKILFLLFCLLCSCEIARGQTSIDQGKKLYLSYGCALCHGWSGNGDGIKSQAFDPPPTNFHHLKGYLHGSDKDSIRRSIQYGIKEDNSIMPAFEDISPEELNQLISYLQSLQKNDKS